ncbi:PREDICTED: uncharacterized protein LOC105368282 isoform X2 [Ceratosolen solmsi marchali]|uniref:Uncharacterized protein LOC105368282 isoform X2 n=1 Tax=Ceratosolen solmsi marchali TaxID=326594 RepID=A0AAJ7E2M3_9HYME|nr:PREDICTED: uncharacterized protein LOC105368282 isoform X2 [Ceratosolen solmsi marchali]
MSLAEILLAVLVVSLTTQSTNVSSLRQIITRNVTAVQLNQGNIMEIIEEQTCSTALIRLTCRSLTSFVFVLEALYQPNRTDACIYNRDSWCKYRSLFVMVRNLQLRRNFLRGSYEHERISLDFRDTINRRCSGHHHCQYKVMSDHPEALFWIPANIRIKYACIPETSVYKYCNAEVNVPNNEGGYLKSPGYPLYYLGGITCGWTFRSIPGQRIVLTFHDLSIRDHEADGSCIDIVRVRDDGNTLFESCGTAAGVKIISNTNVVTLNLVASARLYPARGFFLQYQGCPNVIAPPGSYVSNGTLETRTFLCRAGTLFPDTRQRTRTVHCAGGQWIENIPNLPACVRSSDSIVNNETDSTKKIIGSLDGGINRSYEGILGQETRRGRGPVDKIKIINYSIMEQAQPAVIKDTDYVVDVILPTILIALLFVGNAVIVYIIFQYRKRNVENHFRKTTDTQGEEIVLSATRNGDPQV